MASSPLTDELLELIASGVDVYVATRDAQLEPEAIFAMGLRVHHDRSTVTVYLPELLAHATRKNLEDNGQVAITLERPRDNRSYQLKGQLLGIRISHQTDQDFQSIFRAALVEQFEEIGIPRSTTRRIAWWPSLAVEVCVRDVYLQTPGPAAGTSILAG